MSNFFNASKCKGHWSIFNQGTNILKTLTLPTYQGMFKPTHMYMYVTNANIFVGLSCPGS